MDFAVCKNNCIIDLFELNIPSSATITPSKRGQTSKTYLKNKKQKLGTW